MDIVRNIGDGVVTWTNVVTGYTGTISDYSAVSGTTRTYSAVETAWTGGTLTLAQSSAHTSTTDVAVIYLSGSGATLGLVASINGTLTKLA